MNRRLREKTDRRLAKERGTIYKDPGGKVSVALAYPNTYHVGMSNLGFQGIYGLLNEMHDVVCERVFLPDEEDIEEYVRTGAELFSMESKKSLNRFDIVAFSVSFENDYPNIVRMLQIAHLPPRSEARTYRHPLIIMGGVCTFFNPEPVADFFDVCLTGEGEELLPEFLSAFRASRNREDLYRNLRGVDGIYIPMYYHVTYNNEGAIAERLPVEDADAPLVPIKRRRVKDISSPPMRTVITTPDTEFSEMFLVEAMRGCPWNCRFCVAGKIYGTPRRKSLDEIKVEIAKARETSCRVGLVGPSLSDYPHAADVLKIPSVEFSITSLRASRKSADIVALLKGNKSVSIAPEAGTERLRRVVNKMITEEDIMGTAEALLNSGLRTLRLYFMVGLPTETQADIAGIIELARKIRGLSGKGKIVLSISTFVPKPFTPFQWHYMERPLQVKERLKKIKKDLLSVKGVAVFHDVPKYAYMQGVFSMGDRRISKMLEEMHDSDNWTKAAAGAGINEEFYIFREKSFDEILPWDFLEYPVPKEKLWAEYRESLSVSS